jgi:signal transduction histidine kinase
VLALADFLGNFAQDFLGQAGLRLHLEFPEDLPPNKSLSPESLRHVVASVKEALRNVVRHAHATTVTLRMSFTESRLTVEVSDDGCGFDRFRTQQSGGLVHMRERLSEIGGECVIDSAPGSGTLIRFSLDILETKGTRQRG